jgi:hypothetical protein
MLVLSQEQKHQTLVQLRSGVSTRKIEALVDMRQFFAVHTRKDVRGNIERQRRWRPKLLTDQRRGIVSLLLLKVYLELHIVTTLI